ncbi:MAG TPA: immunoglobulin domain-containing protein [Verrucomicrobiae bacterium]|nr:immunoglobulin domain-containing protein [Verrucomicrobiae bacterium]
MAAPTTLSNCTDVVAGDAHAVARLEDGTVAAWGDNSVGQTNVPAGATQITAIAAGHRHNLALKQDGSLIGWGENQFGQLSPPSNVTNVIAIAAGAIHSLALRSNQTVVAWGGNSSGQASVPLGLNSVKAVAAGAFHNLALRTNGTVVAWGYAGNGQTFVPFGLSNVIAIAAGYYHSLALRANGTVVAWGDNTQGQASVPPGLSNVVAIAGGLSVSLALRQDGTIVSWGEPPAVPEGLTNAQRIAAGANFNLATVPLPVIVHQPTDVLIVPGQDITLTAAALGSGAMMLQWQRNGQDLVGETNATLTIPNAQYDAFGDYRLRVRDGGRTIFSQVARLIAPPAILSQPESLHRFYGTNATFQVLATGTSPLRYQWFFGNSLISAGTNASLTISNAAYQQDGNYFVVVSNLAGSVTSSVAQLVIHTQPMLNLQPALTRVAFDGTLYLSASIAAVWPDSIQWQFNGQDIPGATSSSLQVTNMRPAMSGTYRFVAVTPAGALFSPEVSVQVDRAGPVNFVGRRVVLDAGTGFGTAQGFRWLRDGVELSGHTNSSLVLDPLARSDTGTYTAAVQFASGEQFFETARLTVLSAPAAGTLVHWGLTNNLPGPPLSTVNDFIAIARDYSDLLAVRADGTLFTDDNGQISASLSSSLGPLVGVSAKDLGSAMLGATGKATSDTWSYCSPCGALETNFFIQVAYGDDFAVGLRNDGTVIGWGISGGGNPTPAGLQGIVAVAAGADYAMALRNNGTVVAWGNSYYGQTNVPAGLSQVAAIACGWNHSLALRSNGTVVAWGYNGQGQQTVPPGLSGVAGIAAGVAQSFAIHSNGTVTAWGDNSSGQCNVPLGLTGVVAIASGNYTTTAIVGSKTRPAILDHPVGGVREIGDTITFNVRAWSEGPLAYQWKHAGTNLPGRTSAALTLTNIQVADEGEYVVMVSTTAGTVTSDPATLLVNPNPFLTLPSRGRLHVWGSQSLTDIPVGLGEVSWIAAGSAASGSYVIESDGTARGWSSFSQFILPDTNLVGFIPHNGGYLGLRANGVVQAWNSAMQEIAPPEGLRKVVQLVGNGWGSYLAVHVDGTVRHPFAPDFFPPLTNVIQASLGPYRGAVLLTDGTVVLSNPIQASQQTPVPAGLSNVVQISVGEHHALALLADSTVFAWGRTNEGQCAVPAGLSNVVSIAAGQSFSMALRSNGQVVVWGANNNGQNLLPPGLSNVVAIAAGATHCLALQRGPVIVVPPTDLNVPPGQSDDFVVVAEGAAPLHYQWLHNGGVIPGANQSSLSITATAETEGLYSVIVSNHEGIVTADAMLWLGLPPEILAQPDGATIVSGGSKTFQVLASGFAPLSYQWQLYNTNILGATNSTYTVNAATTSRAGPYHVIVSNVFGAITSQPAVLTVLTAPSFVSQPASQIRAVGESAFFSVVAGGSAPLSYQWRLNGVPLPGATNTALSLSNLTTNQAGVYSCRVTNLVGGVTSQGATLTVVEAAPNFVSAPTNQTAYFGTTVRMDSQAIGASPITYQWYFNGLPKPGATSNSLSLTNVDVTDAGDYQVVANNAFGSVTSAPAQLTLRVSPNVIIWGTNILARQVPPDLTNAVAVSASEHVLALRVDGTISAWGLNDFGQATVPPGLSNVIAVAAGSKESLALRSDGRVFAWGQNFWDSTNVPVDLTNAVAIAAGGLHNLALRSDGTVSGWGYDAYGQASPPAGLTNVKSLTANHNASVALKTDGTVQSWGNGYFPPPGLSNIVRVMGRARILGLRADRRVVGWEWISGGAVEGPPGIVDADSYTVPFTQGSTTYIETHEIGLLTNGTVAVWGTNRGGIFNPPSGLSNVLAVSAGYFFNAAVVGGPTITRQPQDAIGAAGAGVTFNVEAVSRMSLRYQWRFNGTNLPGATNAALTLNSLQPYQGGQYSVIVSDDTGSIPSRTVTLFVSSDAPYVLRQPTNASVLQGSPAAFGVEIVGAPPVQYQWFHNGTAIAGATQAVLNIPVTTLDHAGFYFVHVSNGLGAATSTEAMLTLGIADVVMDNSAALVTGSWLSSTQANQIGTNFLFTPPGTGSKQVQFVPNLVRSGNYRISSRYFFSSQPPLTPALHLVNHAQGSSAVLPGNFTGWNSLGIFNLNSGTANSVVVYDIFPNAGGFGMVDALTFAYQPAFPVIVFPPRSTNVVENSDLILSVVASGVGPFRYQWQRERTNLVGEVASQLVLPSIQRTAVGRYRVLVSTADGSLYSQEALVQVVAPPLQPTLENGLLVLRWDGSAILQTATNVAGPFQDIPQSESPVTIEPSEAQRFFRLKQ